MTVGPPPFSSKDNDPHKEERASISSSTASPKTATCRTRRSRARRIRRRTVIRRSASTCTISSPRTATPRCALAGRPLFETRPRTSCSAARCACCTTCRSSPTSVTTVRAPSGDARSALEPPRRVRAGRLGLEPLTLEDVTKVWTALALRYRLSAAYVVNVVQIESRRPRRSRGRSASRSRRSCRRCRPSAVTRPNGYTCSRSRRRRSPRSRCAAPATTDEQPFPYAAIGDDLVLRGTSLAGPSRASCSAMWRCPRRSPTRRASRRRFPMRRFLERGRSQPSSSCSPASGR